MKFSPQETGRLEAILEALSPWQSTISLSQALALIVIARHPGLSVNELADKLDQPQQTVSRHVAILLGRYQTSETIEPRAFIRQEINVNDPRSRALFLSKDGHSLLKALAASSPKTISAT
jgi:DNA-binding MarR family transcriptional regulator